MLEWCAASEECEGFTHAQPSAGMPMDRLSAGCYCCRVDVRTNRNQRTWTKWAPPSRESHRQVTANMHPMHAHT